MTTAYAPLRLSCCRGECDVAIRHRAHHDRLLAVDTDAEALLDLLEIAVTWHELDYSEADLAAPEHWLTFAEQHAWADPDRAARIFSLAVDIVGRQATGPPPELSRDPSLAQVIQLVQG
jgi:hypothetical protein